MCLCMQRVAYLPVMTVLLISLPNRALQLTDYVFVFNIFCHCMRLHNDGIVLVVTKLINLAFPRNNGQGTGKEFWSAILIRFG